MKTIISSAQIYMQFMCHELNYAPTQHAQCIVDVEAETGKPVAGVIYDAYNGAIIMAHIWVSPDHNPSKDWFCAIFDYPFNRLGVRKIVGQVNSGNLAARKLDEHFGFRLECQVSDFYEDGGSLMVYTMTKEQCRVLNSPLWARAMDRVKRIQ